MPIEADLHLKQFLQMNRRNPETTMTKISRALLACAAIAAFIDPAHAAPVIYEPFGQEPSGSPANLGGQATSGIGLMGNWASGEQSMYVASGSLSYGSLPTSGNSLRSQTRRQGNTAAITSDTLSNAGLLNDNGELWFSLIHKIGPKNTAGAYWGFALATDSMTYQDPNLVNGAGLGVGFRISNTDQLTAGIWNKPSGAESFNAGNAVDLAPGPNGTTFGDTILIVGKITWGADGSAADKVELYLPDTSLNLGSVVSTVTATLDQSQLDSIAFMTSLNNIGQDYCDFDEIRVGATYSDVAPAVSSVQQPQIISFTSVGGGTWELALKGDADTAFELRSSTTLDFTSGTLVENLTQGNPGGDPGTVSGVNSSVVTTDSNGDATVRITLTGSPADFVRAETTTTP